MSQCLYGTLRLMDENLEIIKLSTKELLLSLVDLATPFFLASSIYHQSTKKYLRKRSIDRATFFERISYLKRQGYIKVFTKNKEKYIELTPKGIKHTANLFLEDIVVERKKIWDKKWRVVIFDIPEKIKQNRDVFRQKLNELKFIQIQKSVYVYPFECTPEITTISQILNITKYVTIMISEIIQGEEKILELFLDNEVLQKRDLRK